MSPDQSTILGTRAPETLAHFAQASSEMMPMIRSRLGKNLKGIGILAASSCNSSVTFLTPIWVRAFADAFQNARLPKLETG